MVCTRRGVQQNHVRRGVVKSAEVVASLVDRFVGPLVLADVVDDTHHANGAFIGTVLVLPANTPADLRR